MTPEERRWIESICTGRTRRQDAKFVHQSFETHAAAAPEATALRFRDRSLTYRELNASANALARHLIAKGIGAESRVAVCLEPSFDAVIALLAVWKAGAVYVPLDPTVPAARLRASLDEIQPSLVIAREHREELTTLTPDEIGRLPTESSDKNPDLPIDPEQTAYIYYTSGSTGKPKGAMASQANLRYYIETARAEYQIGASDVFPSLARFSFSISLFEVMSPLTAGGTLILLERDHVLDPARLARTLTEATFFHAGPSLLKNLIAHIKLHSAELGGFSQVRHVSTGGDMVPPEVLEGLKQVFPKAEVFVIYGCSESTPMGCMYPVPRDRPVERSYVGRPFDNTLVRLLDPSFGLLPVGEVGEIYFSGPGVGKGYLNQPGLTAERFVMIDGRRFYRTGDMGRLGKDGCIEFLGRSDFQIKLRGIRIELGEVEHALRRAPGVRDGVAAAKRVVGDEKSLVAYVVMLGQEDDPAQKEARLAAVRRFMSENLPDYMVPALYIELASLPLNHNMKLDRNALPEPEAAHSRGASDPTFREPRTETEKRLASIWEKLLGFDRVGLDDNFFDLGGNSLLGIQLILEVDKEFGVALQGMDVLREPLAVQAAICDRRPGTAAAVAAPNAAYESFHFGADRSLYGILSGPATGTEAVLICAPVGYEQVRTQFILKRLSKLLADKGVPALRFHYYGCGDSLGESAAATCGRWRRDIGEAYRELKSRTGATRITAVGVRLGAALLSEVSGELPFARLVLWDPVLDGAKYYAELVDTQEKYRRSSSLWWFLNTPAPTPGGTELQGAIYSETLQREVKALNLDPDRAGHRGDVKRLDMGRSDRDPGWNDIARLEQILPDAGIAGSLAAMATERS